MAHGCFAVGTDRGQPDACLGHLLEHADNAWEPGNPILIVCRPLSDIAGNQRQFPLGDAKVLADLRGNVLMACGLSATFDTGGECPAVEQNTDEQVFQGPQMRE